MIFETETMLIKFISNLNIFVYYNYNILNISNDVRFIQVTVKNITIC